MNKYTCEYLRIRLHNFCIRRLWNTNTLSKRGPQRWHASPWVRWGLNYKQKSMGFPGFPLENDLQMLEFSKSCLFKGPKIKTLASSFRILHIPRISSRIVLEGRSIDSVKAMGCNLWPRNYSVRWSYKLSTAHGGFPFPTTDKACHVSDSHPNVLWNLTGFKHRYL